MRGRMRRKEVRKTSRVNGYKTAFFHTPVRSKMLLCLSCAPPAHLSSDISIVGEEESVRLLKMSLIYIAEVLCLASIRHPAGWNLVLSSTFLEGC